MRLAIFSIDYYILLLKPKSMLLKMLFLFFYIVSFSVFINSLQMLLVFHHLNYLKRLVGSTKYEGGNNIKIRLTRWFFCGRSAWFTTKQISWQMRSTHFMWYIHYKKHLKHSAERRMLISVNNSFSYEHLKIKRPIYLAFIWILGV